MANGPYERTEEALQKDTATFVNAKDIEIYCDIKDGGLFLSRKPGSRKYPYLEQENYLYEKLRKTDATAWHEQSFLGGKMRRNTQKRWTMGGVLGENSCLPQDMGLTFLGSSPFSWAVTAVAWRF